MEFDYISTLNIVSCLISLLIENELACHVIAHHAVGDAFKFLYLSILHEYHCFSKNSTFFFIAYSSVTVIFSAGILVHLRERLVKFLSGNDSKVTQKIVISIGHMSTNETSSDLLHLALDLIFSLGRCKVVVKFFVFVLNHLGFLK